MGNQVIPGYSTHKEPYSPFYEGDQGNDDFPLPSEGMPITQGVVPQRDTLRNMI